MPIDPEKLKQDPRSPQELAKAILDHELTPSGQRSSRMTFREQLLCDYGGEEEKKYGRDLLWALKAVEDNLAVSVRHRRSLSHGLQLVDAYRRESTAFRDMAEIEANPDMPPKNRVQQSAKRKHVPEGPHAEKLERAAQEQMARNAVEISNLKSIDKLIRALAQKLRIALIEPGHHK